MITEVLQLQRQRRRWAGPRTTVYAWNRSATVPIVQAVRDATLAVDDNLPSFTDPQTGITQTDPGSGRLYIAWEDDVPVPPGFPAALWNLNAIDVLTSVNGTLNFANANTLTEVGGPHAAGTPNYEADAAPRLAISQGTPDGSVAGGQVTVIYDDFHSAGVLIGSPTVVDPIFATAFTPNGGGLSDNGRHRRGLHLGAGRGQHALPAGEPVQPDRHRPRRGDRLGQHAGQLAARRPDLRAPTPTATTRRGSPSARPTTRPTTPTSS